MCLMLLPLFLELPMLLKCVAKYSAVNEQWFTCLSLLCDRYFVFSDPPGPKVGDGGALMNALEQLAEQDSGQYLEQGKQ